MKTTYAYKLFLLIGLTLFCLNNTFGQLDTIAQFSRVNSAQSKYVRSYLLSSNEILVESININKANTTFEKFDANFNVIDTLELPSHPGATKLSANNGPFIYTIFFTNDLNYFCYTINKYTFEVTHLEGKLPHEMPSTAIITNGYVCIFMGIKQRVESYAMLDFRTGKFEEIPIQLTDFQKPKIITTTKSSVSLNNEIFLYYNVYIKRKNIPVLLQLNEDGQLKATHKFTTTDPKFQALEADVTYISGDTYLITGQWGEYSKRELETTGKGVYVTRIVNGKADFFKTYKYSEMKNLYNYRSRANNDNSGSKTKLIEGNVDFHNYKLDENNVLITGPLYSKEIITTNNSMLQTTHNYRYYQGLAILFDLDGVLKWSESYTIDFNKIMHYPIDLVNYWNYDDDILIIANSPTSSRKIVINREGEVIEETILQNIAQPKLGFEIPDYPYKVYYWMDDFYITFGSFKFKEPSEEDGKEIEKTKYVMYKLKLE